MNNTKPSSQLSPCPLFVLRGHESSINQLKFHPNHQDFLISGDSSGIVKIWHLNLRRAVCTFSIFDKANEQALNSDQNAQNQADERNFSGDNGNIDNPESIHGGLLHLEIIQSTNHLLTQGRDGFIRLWYTNVFTHDDKTLWSMASANSVELLFSIPSDALSFCKFSKLELTTSSIPTVIQMDPTFDTLTTKSFASVSVLVAVCMEDPHRFIIWNLYQCSVFTLIEAEQKQDRNTRFGLCLCMKLFTRNANLEDTTYYLCSLYESGDLILWRVSSSKQHYSVITQSPSYTNSMFINQNDTTHSAFYSSSIISKRKLHSEPGLCLDIDHDFHKGVTVSAGNNIVVFTINYEQDSIDILHEYELKRPGINAVRIRSNDEKIIATAGWDHRVRIFAWKKFRPLAILKDHTGSVNALDFSSHKNWLASGGQDKRICIWSVY